MVGGRKVFCRASSREADEEEREQGAALYTYVKEWFDRLPQGNEWDPLLLLGWVSDFVRKYAPARSLDDINVGGNIAGDDESIFNKSI